MLLSIETPSPQYLVAPTHHWRGKNSLFLPLKGNKASSPLEITNTFWDGVNLLLSKRKPGYTGSFKLSKQEATISSNGDTTKSSCSKADLKNIVVLDNNDRL